MKQLLAPVTASLLVLQFVISIASAQDTQSLVAPRDEALDSHPPALSSLGKVRVNAGAAIDVNALPNPSPPPCRGSYANGFAPLAERFAAQVRDGSEIGAALTVHHRGRCVVDLWGGQADVERATPWERDTRIVVFSATKGLAAMALAVLANRGQLDWAPLSPATGPGSPPPASMQ